MIEIEGKTDTGNEDVHHQAQIAWWMWMSTEVKGTGHPSIMQKNNQMYTESSHDSKVIGWFSEDSSCSVFEWLWRRSLLFTQSRINIYKRFLPTGFVT